MARIDGSRRAMGFRREFVMKLVYVALCLIMAARSLMRYTRRRAPSRLLLLFFWIVLLIYSLTSFRSGSAKRAWILAMRPYRAR